MKVFIDTGVFIAYFLKREIHHEKVVQKYQFYRQAHATFITSNYIIDELLTWFTAKQTRMTLEKIVTALEQLEISGGLQVFYIDKHLHKKAEKILLKFSEHNISLTDATSAVIYKDFGFDEIFTLDSDFKKMRLKTAF